MRSVIQRLFKPAAKQMSNSEIMDSAINMAMNSVKLLETQIFEQEARIFEQEARVQSVINRLAAECDRYREALEAIRNADGRVYPNDLKDIAQKALEIQQPPAGGAK